jgi:hypothetical protein
MSDDVHEAFAFVLQHYVRARTSERLGKGSATWQRLMKVPLLLASTTVMRRHPRVVVRASAGQGSWARIPWVALMHMDVTSTTCSGVYAIFLFRADMSGVYLTLNQGVTEPLQRMGTEAGTAWVRRRAQELRGRVGVLAASGFELIDTIDLRNDQPSGQTYAASTIAHKLYQRGSLPGDADLLADIDAVLEAYEGIRPNIG